MRRMAKKFVPHYSGDASREFWGRVDSLHGKDLEAAYMMGVMLQDLEGRVLRFVEELLAEKPKKKKK